MDTKLQELLNQYNGALDKEPSVSSGVSIGSWKDWNQSVKQVAADIAEHVIRTVGSSTGVEISKRYTLHPNMVTVTITCSKDICTILKSKLDSNVLNYLWSISGDTILVDMSPSDLRDWVNEHSFKIKNPSFLKKEISRLQEDIQLLESMIITEEDLSDE